MRTWPSSRGFGGDSTVQPLNLPSPVRKRNVAFVVDMFAASTLKQVYWGKDLGRTGCPVQAALWSRRSDLVFFRRGSAQ